MGFIWLILTTVSITSVKENKITKHQHYCLFWRAGHSLKEQFLQALCYLKRCEFLKLFLNLGHVERKLFKSPSNKNFLFQHFLTFHHFSDINEGMFRHL